MKFILVCLLVAVVYAQAETYPADDGVEVRCDNGACMRSCWAYGWVGGRCSGGTCQCYRFKSDDLAFDSQMAACDFGRCLRTCMSSGWSSGYCRGNDCVCQGRPSLLHIASSAQHEIAGPSSRMACEAKNCILYCQRMGKIGGKCVGGRCWCF